MLREFQGKTPSVAADAYVADGAILIGAVTLKEGSSVWFNSVLRADSEPITIGRFTNVQDNSTLHVDPGFPCVVGDHVTIGHGAIVHACTVEDNVLIGMHATVLSGAIVGRDSIVGANALVTENARIPPGSLVLGVPGKVVRSLKPEEIEGIRRSAEGYVRRAAQYRVRSPDSDGCA
jgi:carbonic anhydrase/acetyltransferase-like protein (isoleucine patch superfamily)